MPKRIEMNAFGGPEVLQYREFEPSSLSANEVLIRQAAIGLNFIDVYHRTGLYPLKLPAVIGVEGAGIVEAVGEQVQSLRAGMRVVYGGGLGAYADYRVLSADRAINVPDGVTLEIAASHLFKGITADYLLKRAGRVEPGQTIVVLAAAGGVGALLSQWASSSGVTVIGIVGSQAKKDLARRNGCSEVIVSEAGGYQDIVKKMTNGKGADVVFDSVGLTSFESSLQALKPFGTLVSFGQSSGLVAPIDPRVLTDHGSIFLARPSFGTHTASLENYRASGEAVLQALQERRIGIPVSQTFPLAEAARAHNALEGRETVNASLLVP